METRGLYQESIKRQRIDWLDIAKGLGIIAVVVSHSYCCDLIWIVMAWYVPVFFVCSGFTLKRKSNYTDFIVKKSKRLLLPYLFCMVLMTIFNFLSDLFLHQPFDFFRSTVGVLYSRTMLYPMDAEVNQLMLPKNTQPLWFLTALLASLLLAYPLLGVVKRKCMMLITALVLMALSYLFTFCPILLPWSLDTLPLFVLMVLFGVWIREYEWMKMPWYTYILMLIVYVGMLYFIGDINFSVREYGTSLLMTVVSALSGSLLLMKLSQMMARIQWLNKPLSILGQHSLYIMCFHFPVLTVCGKVIDALPFSGTILLCLSLSSVIIAIFVGYLLSVLVQRYIPFLKFN